MELEKRAWIGLAQTYSLKRAHSLIKQYGSALSAWRAKHSYKDLPEVNDKVLCPVDKDYPKSLLDLPQFPLILYKKGGRIPTDRPRVAVVGSRRASPYGLSLAAKIGNLLSSHGVSVISGLARGIDGIAHKNSLTPKGFPIGVLANGLDITYPPEHKTLKKQISRYGTIITEYPFGTPPAPWRFPARNRIIAALAHCVIVVEAALKSGALITAKWALELGRDVMAIPGPIDSPTSQGTNRLIRDGAIPISSLNDILPALGLPQATCNKPKDPILNEAYSLLNSQGTNAVELSTYLNISLAASLSILQRLQVEGYAQKCPDGTFIPI